MDWSKLNILITGGTGSFGKKFIEIVAEKHQPNKVIVFSRDELKQFEMQQKFTGPRYRCLRYFLGDVRDKERLMRAFDNVDIVVHAAALKQVPAAEYNPLEAIKTNIMGAANIIDAAIDRGVQKVIALSTDKACSPINLYGATKLCSDKLFIAANSYSGHQNTRFSVVRYGNVVGSRGSVVPFFKSKLASGVLPVTDPRMTRFWITLPQGARFVINRLEHMEGGELFVPKIPSMNIMDLAKAISPDCRTEVVGIRPGEKLHEVMITEDDARHTYELADYFVLLPSGSELESKYQSGIYAARPCPEDFRYASDTNTQWLAIDKLQQMIQAGETEETHDPV